LSRADSVRSLVSGFTIGADQTVTNSDRSPASGYTGISGSVSSIQSEFNFTLSALDQSQWHEPV
jgi:hypothetical protein